MRHRSPSNNKNSEASGERDARFIDLIRGPYLRAAITITLILSGLHHRYARI
jgi:hypothetical protein